MNIMPQRSEIVKILKRGHHNVALTDPEWRTLYNWIDFNAPYHGAFEAKPDDFYGCKDPIARRIELTNKYANNAGVNWQKEIDDFGRLPGSKRKASSRKTRTRSKKSV